MNGTVKCAILSAITNTIVKNTKRHLPTKIGVPLKAMNIHEHCP